MKRTNISLLFVVFLSLQLLTGLIVVEAQDEAFELALTFDNLADPGEDHYEGWIIIDGSPVSTGKFSIDIDGKIVDLDGNEIENFQINLDPTNIEKFVLSLEPSGDTDDVPAAIKPLAGEFNSDKTEASISQNVGDFSSISGNYIVATPTNGPDTDENAGIWFLDSSGMNPVAGLDLPDLTGTDWVYEGWVVFDGTPVSTGVFDKPDEADDSALFSGSDDAPPFPGEDFLMNAPAGLTFPTSLAGLTAVISIEPRVDNSPEPFQFKPLVGSIPSTLTGDVYSMDDMSDTMATGTASLSEASSGLLPGFELPLVILGLASISLILVSRRRA